MPGGWGEAARTFGPPLIAAGASIYGAQQQNTQSREEAEKNRGFQERMRNTQWQAGVEDMRAAGLNPALAYQQGSASAPGGNQAPISNVAEGAVSSAMQMARLGQEIKLMKQQVREQNAKADVAEDSKWWSETRRKYYDKGDGPGLGIVGGPSLSDMKDDRLDALLGSEHGRALAQAMREQGLARISGIGGNVAQQFQKFVPPLGRVMDVASGGAGQLAGLVEGLERVARMRDGAVRSYLGMPKAAVIKLLERLKRRN